MIVKAIRGSYGCSVGGLGVLLSAMVGEVKWPRVKSEVVNWRRVWESRKAWRSQSSTSLIIVVGLRPN